MNILIIPSWYPNPDEPVQGIFVYDQVRAMAERYPDSRFFVSAVHSFVLPLEKPGTSLYRLCRYRASAGSARRIIESDNFLVFMTPCLEWTDKILEGNFRRRLAIHKNHISIIHQYSPIDLIHAHVSYPAGYAAMLLSAELKIPYVLTEHMSPFPFQRPSFIDASGRLTDRIRRPIVNASKVIAVSPELANSFNRYGLPSPAVIPNLVDDDRFVPAAGRSDGRVRFLSFSSMVPQKGFDILIRSIALIPRDREDLHFTIAGTGPNLIAYKKLAQELGCDDRIHWKGAVDRNKVPSLFQECDAFILPSRHESFGIVYIEAMACGKPVIATRCGGPEHFVHEENGILIPVENPEAAAEAILEMANRIHQFDAATIRKQILERFSKKTVTGLIMKTYQDILQ